MVILCEAYARTGDFRLAMETAVESQVLARDLARETIPTGAGEAYHDLMENCEGLVDDLNELMLELDGEHEVEDIDPVSLTAFVTISRYRHVQSR